MSRETHIAAHCFMQKTRRAARQVTTLFEDAMAPVDLTGGQFSILLAISIQGEPSISGLAHGLGMDRTTLSRGVKPLERRGLVSVVVDGDDSRVRNIKLEADGRALLKQAIPLWERAQKQVLRTLENFETDTVQEALDRLGRT